jgi:hypothetical protein
MGGYTHRLSFLARHSSADLSILPTTLGVTAHSLWKAGDLRLTPKGGVSEVAHKNSYCSIKFDGLADLPQSIVAALEGLKRHEALLRSLAENGVKFAFFIGWFSEWNSHDVFSWQLLNQLADLRISLEFDFYGPKEKQEEPMS